MEKMEAPLDDQQAGLQVEGETNRRRTSGKGFAPSFVLSDALDSRESSVESDVLTPLYSADTTTSYTNVFAAETVYDDISEGEWKCLLDGVFDEFCESRIDDVEGVIVGGKRVVPELIDPEVLALDIERLEKVFNARKKRKFKRKHPVLSKLIKRNDNSCTKCFRTIRTRFRFKQWIHHPDLFFKTGWLLIYLRLQYFIAIIYQMPFVFIPELYRGIFYPLKLIGGLDFSSFFNESWSKYLSTYTWLSYGLGTYFHVQFVILWISIPAIIIILWFLSIRKKHYTTEKILFLAIRILYFPLLVKFGPWLGCSGIGDIFGVSECVPNPYYLVLFGLFAVFVPLLLFLDIRKRIIYPSPKGHLEFLEFLETEKLLRFSNAYVKMKMYKVATFQFRRIGRWIFKGPNFHIFAECCCVNWSIFLFWILFGYGHPKFLCASTTIILISLALTEIVVLPYRLTWHLVISQTSLWVTIFMCFLVWMKAVDLMNPFFVDNTLAVTMLFFSLLAFTTVTGIMVYGMFQRRTNWPVCEKEIRRREPEILRLIQRGYFLFFYSININPYFVRVDLVEYFIGILEETLGKVRRVSGHPLIWSIEHILYKLKTRYFEIKDISLYSRTSNRLLKSHVGELRNMLTMRQIDTCHIPKNKRRLLFKFRLLKEFGRRVREYFRSKALVVGVSKKKKEEDQRIGVVVKDDTNLEPIFGDVICRNFDSQFYNKAGKIKIIQLGQLDDEESKVKNIVQKIGETSEEEEREEVVEEESSNDMIFRNEEVIEITEKNVNPIRVHGEESEEDEDSHHEMSDEYIATEQ